MANHSDENSDDITEESSGDSSEETAVGNSEENAVKDETAETSETTIPSEPARMRAVAFGVEEPVMTSIRAAMPRVGFVELPLNIKTMLTSPVDFDPHLIFCGKCSENTSSDDVAQGIRSLYATAPIYYATAERKGFDRVALTKSGFTDAFLMPLDQPLLHELATEGIQDFRPVQLVDITPDTTLDFDTFVLLPINRKYVRFNAAGRSLDPERIQRLLDKQIASVYIARQDMKTFLDFTARQLQNLATPSEEMSKTEQRERMQAAVRSLLTGLLTNASEMQDCAQIVQSYILGQSNDENSTYEKILLLSSATADNRYAHVSNVSTIASLLAMALAPESVEDVAIAALLHDIGEANVPNDIQFKDPGARSPEEQELYQRHPSHSVELLKERSIQLSEKVLKIIEQHHERFDGAGYPAKIADKDLLLEAQLIAVADEFAYQNVVTVGMPRPVPHEIIRGVLDNEGARSPELIDKIRNLFAASEDEHA